MMIEYYDDWLPPPPITTTTRHYPPPLANSILGWSNKKRDEKIGVVLGLLRGSSGGDQLDEDEEKREMLMKLRSHLAKEKEHHLRYLSHINQLFIPELSMIRAKGEMKKLTKGELFGGMFHKDRKEKRRGIEIKILSIPNEFKFLTTTNLKKLNPHLNYKTTSYRTNSLHFVCNEYDDESDPSTIINYSILKSNPDISSIRIRRVQEAKAWQRQIEMDLIRSNPKLNKITRRLSIANIGSHSQGPLRRPRKLPRLTNEINSTPFNPQPHFDSNEKILHPHPSSPDQLIRSSSSNPTKIIIDSPPSSSDLLMKSPSLPSPDSENQLIIIISSSDPSPLGSSPQTSDLILLNSSHDHDHDH